MAQDLSYASHTSDRPEFEPAPLEFAVRLRCEAQQIRLEHPFQQNTDCHAVAEIMPVVLLQSGRATIRRLR